MSYARKSLSKVLASVIAVLAIVAIAIWQFYLFVTFRNSQGLLDEQGGTLHLWLAIALAVCACIGSFFVFSVFLKHDRDDELHITS
ncbi:MAG: hypothetical protein ACRD8U_14140 [Pyrinomonadaceae bacterium]